MCDIQSAKKQNSQKHRKNSQYHKTYKAKSAYSPKVEQSNNKNKPTTSSASKLPSNWDKYDRNIDDCDAPHAVGIEFSTLSLLPTSNSQFQLKQDKVFLPRSDCTANTCNIFEIDLNLINLSLATIPFYRRINMEESLLTHNEIDDMDKKACAAHGAYHKYFSVATAASDISQKQDQDSPSENDTSNCDEVEIRSSELDILDVVPSAYSGELELETTELEEWLENQI